MELRTPWGRMWATPTSFALGAAVLAGWYLTLEQVGPAKRRELSIAYAAAWLGAATELLILRSLDAPQAFWPVAATLAAVVSVALVSDRGALARRLDTLAPALGAAYGLSLVSGPTLPLAVACAVALLAAALRPRVSGQRFLITCAALLAFCT